jgi:hypothetical protein
MNMEPIKYAIPLRRHLLSVLSVHLNRLFFNVRTSLTNMHQILTATNVFFGLFTDTFSTI